MRCGLTLAVALCLALDWPVATQAATALQRLEIVTPRGTRTATLHMPAGASRVPVVVLVSSGGGEKRSGMADALGTRGLASLRPDAADDAVADPAGAIENAARDVAAWITRLRNDSRFDRIMVVGVESGFLTAMRAARAARADGLVLLGPPESNRAVVSEWSRPSIPISLFPGDPLEPLVQFVWRTSIRRHPEGERRSPRDVVMADIAGSRISIEHGRPSKRGRVIWGTLVPWGRWWMPGADEATTLTTSKTLEFGKLIVPAGDYTIYTEPSDTAFMLIINQETGQFHTTYHPERDLGRVEMQRGAAPAPAEQLTFAVEAQGSGGVVKLIWDDREYSVPFAVGR